MTILYEGILNLQRAGVTDVLIPFILIFAITFGILSKIELFGKDKSKKFNVLIALAMALIPVFQHVLYPGSPYDVISVMNKSIPQIGLVTVAIVCLFLILGLMGAKVGEGQSGWPASVVTLLGIGFVVYVFGSNYGIGWWSLPAWRWLNRETISIIVAVVVFALVIGYVTRDDEAAKAKNGEGFKELGKFFGFK
jgi:hypothetical protein